jgi:hypothetical protein
LENDDRRSQGWRLAECTADLADVGCVARMNMPRAGHKLLSFIDTMDELRRRMPEAEFDAFAKSLAKDTANAYRICSQKYHELECKAGNHWIVLVNGINQCLYCGAHIPGALDDAPDRGVSGNPVSSSPPKAG